MSAVGVLDGRVVVVTGAGRGIGREVALAAGAAGAAVVVADHGVALDGGVPSSTIAEAVAGEVVAAGGEATSVGDTVVTMDGARRIIAVATERYGRVDGVVCCAGIQRPGTFLELSEDDFDAVVATHLRGHFTVMQTAARAMVNQGGGGSLVAMGSGYLSGTPTLANYRAAKAGVLALTLTAAMDLAGTGIRANCVAPAANTRMTAGHDVLIDGEPADVSPLAIYLLSDLAGEVNGQIFSIAGSRIAGWSDPYEDRVVRKDGRWTVAELAREVPGLVHAHPADGAGVLLSAPLDGSAA